MFCFLSYLCFTLELTRLSLAGLRLQSVHIIAVGRKQLKINFFLAQNAKQNWYVLWEYYLRPHWRSVILGCQPSATDHFRSPLPKCGMVIPAAAHYVSAVSWHFSVSPEDPSVHLLLWCLMIVQSLHSDSHFGHYNRFCYLLTYLLTFSWCYNSQEFTVGDWPNLD